MLQNAKKPDSSSFCKNGQTWMEDVCYFASQLNPGTVGPQVNGICAGYWGEFIGHTWASSLHESQNVRRNLLVGSNKPLTDSDETEYNPRCDMPDCEYYNDDRECSQCHQTKTTTVSGSFPEIWNPVAPFLWKGQCHSDCEALFGENVVNGDDGTCVCREGTHEDPVTGNCLTCDSISHDCESCSIDFTDPSNPLFNCETCKDTY